MGNVAPSNSDPGCEQSPCEDIPDTRIRFMINKMYIRDVAWDNDQGISPTKRQCPSTIDQIGDYSLTAWNGFSCPTTNEWYTSIEDLHQQLLADNTLEPAINMFVTSSGEHLANIQNTHCSCYYDNHCSMSNTTVKQWGSARVHLPDLYVQTYM